MFCIIEVEDVAVRHVSVHKRLQGHIASQSRDALHLAIAQPDFALERSAAIKLLEKLLGHIKLAVIPLLDLCQGIIAILRPMLQHEAVLDHVQLYAPRGNVNLSRFLVCLSACRKCGR